MKRSIYFLVTLLIACTVYGSRSSDAELKSTQELKHIPRKGAIALHIPQYVWDTIHIEGLRPLSHLWLDGEIEPELAAAEGQPNKKVTLNDLLATEHVPLIALGITQEIVHGKAHVQVAPQYPEEIDKKQVADDAVAAVILLAHNPRAEFVYDEKNGEKRTIERLDYLGLYTKGHPLSISLADFMQHYKTISRKDGVERIARLTELEKSRHLFDEWNHSFDRKSKTKHESYASSIFTSYQSLLKHEPNPRQYIHLETAEMELLATRIFCKNMENTTFESICRNRYIQLYSRSRQWPAMQQRIEDEFFEKTGVEIVD